MADTKPSAATEVTAPTADLLFPGTEDPDGTPLDRVTPFSMVGLVSTSEVTTDANITATPGEWTIWDISGHTADRDWILPDTAKVGQFCGLWITTGDDTYCTDIVTAASGSMINGADHSSTPWRKAYKTGSWLIAVCVKAGGAGDTDFRIIHDSIGGVFCHMVAGSTQNQSVSTGSYTALHGASGTGCYEGGSHDDRYGWITESTGAITPTIAGKYLVTQGTLANSLGDAKLYIQFVGKNWSSGTGSNPTARGSTGVSGNQGMVGPAIIEMNGTTDYIKHIVWHNQGSNINFSQSPTYTYMTMQLIEAY